jgi:hypothetical protein
VKVRRWWIGGALVALYVGVVVGTNLTTGHPVRPLFDGAAGSTPYKWVKPPWYVGSVNIEPKASSSDIGFENGVSPLIGVTSDDAQMILNLPQGALPGKEGATGVRATFTPLDPKKLAKLPSPLRPNGNAYRVEMAYQPSGEPVRQTATSGNVIMVVPDEAEEMLYSVDGKSWAELPTHRLGDPTTVGSAFNKPGYYLVGTALPEFANPNKESGTKKTVGTVMIVVALALLLGYVLPFLLRRSREAQEVEQSRRRTAPTRQVKRRKR